MKQHSSKLLPYVFSKETFFMFSLMVSYFLNFLFNIFIGRSLSIVEFGIVIFINSLWYFVGIFLNALATTTNYKTSFLVHRINKAAGSVFLQSLYKRFILLGVVGSMIWLCLTPFLSSFFHISNIQYFVFFTPVIIFGVVTSINRGFLQGNQLFISAGILYIAETVIKLFLAFIFVALHLNSFVYLSIPLSIFGSFLISYFLVKRIFVPSKAKYKATFPTQFYFSNMITNIATIAFLTLDLVLAKHYLSPVEAGEYGLLNLLGKIIFFFGSLLSIFLITKIAQLEGQKKNVNPTFYKLLGISTVLCLFIFIFLELFGSISLQILFGEKALIVLPLILPYTLAIILFTLSNIIVGLHLVKKHFKFSLLSVLSVCLLAFGIKLHHSSIADIVSVVLYISILNTILISAFHLAMEFSFFRLRLFFVGKFLSYEK